MSAEAASLGGAVLLDTNVLSELLRAQPDPAVLAWFAAQDQHQLFVSAVTQAVCVFSIRVSSTIVTLNNAEVWPDSTGTLTGTMTWFVSLLAR